MLTRKERLRCFASGAGSVLELFPAADAATADRAAEAFYGALAADEKCFLGSRLKPWVDPRLVASLEAVRAADERAKRDTCAAAAADPEVPPEAREVLGRCAAAGRSGVTMYTFGFAYPARKAIRGARLSILRARLAARRVQGQQGDALNAGPANV